MLTRRVHCATQTLSGDAKLYYARKLLRINDNEKAKERLDVLVENNGENAEIRRKLNTVLASLLPLPLLLAGPPAARNLPDLTRPNH